MDELIAQVQAALTPDLLKPQYRGSDNPLYGHCYVASEALFWLLGGPGAGFQPRQIRHEGVSHWFLFGPDGPVDPTVAQFDTPVPYEKSRGAAFLFQSRGPSERAKIVMERVRGAN